MKDKSVFLISYYGVGANIIRIISLYFCCLLVFWLYERDCLIICLIDLSFTVQC